jgi:adenylate cyclase
MRYRTKLALAMSLLVAFTGGLVLALYYHQSRAILFRQIQSQVLSVASTAAAEVDGDLLETIRSRGDEKSGAYATIERNLREMRNANRRDDVYVRFVYAMRRTSENPPRWIYVVDSQEDDRAKSHVGDAVIFVSDTGQQLMMDRPYAEESFSHDSFGTWLSANAPIRDAKGRAVGVLGVDIAADQVLAKLRKLLLMGAAATAGAVAVAIVLALVTAQVANVPLAKIRAAVQRIGEGDWDTRVTVRSRDEFGAVAQAVNEMAVALRDREMLKGALTRYVSRDVAESVLADRELPSLRGERREITVLIADIRDFTALSESVSPEVVVRFLNVFFGRMIEAIFSCRGTLDKFTGDGVLAIFGAPLDDPQHHRMAVQAAVEMLKESEALRTEMQSEFAQHLRIGIALHSGHAVVGNIGSEQRMEYTAIGDAVYVSSGIEAMNMEYGTDVVVFRAVVDAVGDACGAFREVAETRLRGVQHPIRLYTIDAEARRAANISTS